MSNPIHSLRILGLIEAVSFLLLVGIAMPLKYAWGQPLGVKVFGWIHGVLFILFGAALVRAMLAAKWPFSRAVLVFVAALLPFGPFLIDKRMRKFEDEFSSPTNPSQIRRKDCLRPD